MKTEQPIERLKNKTICPLCDHDGITPLSSIHNSKVSCDNCKAIFYNPDDMLDKEKAGTFTGMYAPLTKKTLIKNRFNKE